MTPEVLAKYPGSVRLALAICFLNSNNGTVRVSHAKIPKHLYRRMRTEKLIGKSETAQRLHISVCRDLEPFREELKAWLEEDANVEQRSVYTETYYRETMASRMFGGAKPRFGERFLPRR